MCTGNVATIVTSVSSVTTNATFAVGAVGGTADCTSSTCQVTGDQVPPLTAGGATSRIWTVVPIGTSIHRVSPAGTSTRVQVAPPSVVYSSA